MARFGGLLELNQGNGSGVGRHGLALTLTLYGQQSTVGHWMGRGRRKLLGGMHPALDFIHRKTCPSAVREGLQE